MKKIKSIWMYALIAVLSVAMMFGSLNLVAFAATAPEGALHETGVIPEEVFLGSTFTLPAATGELVVKAPNGEKVTANGEGLYTANKLGNYSVVYSKDGNSYTYSIFCKEKSSYSIKVADNGATVPTFVKVGYEFEAPEFWLVDADGEIVESAVCNYQINGSTETGKYTFDKAASYTVTLKANFVKDYIKDYIVTVQQDFEDKEAPILKGLSSVPSSASINKEVTLPKATATDNYDENVLVTVSVKDPDGNAISESLDNIDNMKFVPTKKGQYTVTYQAIDDAGNKSSEHNYNIYVNDNTAPEIEVNGAAIPSKWGLNGGRNPNGGELKSITALPLPTVTDNFDAPGQIKLRVTVKNPSGSIASRFSNVTFETASSETGVSADASYSNNVVDGYSLHMDARGIHFVNTSTDATGGFNFKHFKNAKTGVWNIVYEAVDTSGRWAKSVTFSIDVKDAEFEDETAPVITEPNLPKYVIADADRTFAVPEITVSDDSDTRLDEQFYLANMDVKPEDADSTYSRMDVKGGDELKFEVEGGNIYLVKETDESVVKILLIDDIYFKYEVTDDVGNNSTFYKTIEVLTAEDGIVNSDITVDIDTAAERKSGEAQNIGGFTVDNIVRPEFVGFELSILDAKGEVIPTVSCDFYYNANSLFVKNITFNPAEAGTYTVNIRVVDVRNNSAVVVKKLTVAEGDINNNYPVNSSAWVSNAVTRTGYMFKNETLYTGYNDCVRVYNVKGGQFKVIGYEFFPISQGTYNITEKAVREANLATDLRAEASSAYTLSATGSNETRFEVYGTIPAYTEVIPGPTSSNKYESGRYFELEPIVAYSEFGQYDVTVKYTDPDGNTSAAKKIFENGSERLFENEIGTRVGFEFYGRFALILDNDGTYTVTVSANNKTKTYTIKVGDVIAPQFVLDTEKVTGAKVGDAFSYRAVTLKEGEVASDVTVYYTLTDPSGAEVASGDKSYNVYRATLTKDNGKDVLASDYKFAKSGDYTVTYTLTDEHGNSSTLKYTISVSTTTSSTPTSLTALSTVLIIIGVLLIIGVVIYVIRSRKGAKRA